MRPPKWIPPVLLALAMAAPPTPVVAFPDAPLVRFRAESNQAFAAFGYSVAPRRGT